jgi:hypothetical protein
MKKILMASAAAAAIMLTGCGGGGSYDGRDDDHGDEHSVALTFVMFDNATSEQYSYDSEHGEIEDLNGELQKASRLADFIELGELMAMDALQREESCGGHFREEYQTPEGEALRNDTEMNFVAVWEYKGEEKDPAMHKEALDFEFIEVKQRNYK